MGLNRQSGDMYGFVTHTWNPIRGRCEHDCTYCYIKKMYNGKLFEKPCRLVESELKTDLGKGNFIFVGSSTDMFGEWVNNNWIQRVMWHCKKFNNKYLFQSKNVSKLFQFRYQYPKDSVLATTIESNREGYSKAPPVIVRAEGMKGLKNSGFETMITIEPIMDFDLSSMLELIRNADPDIVTIGADSKNNGLPEPSKNKLVELITHLSLNVNVRLKDNLKRLTGINE